MLVVAMREGTHLAHGTQKLITLELPVIILY